MSDKTHARMMKKRLLAVTAKLVELRSCATPVEANAGVSEQLAEAYRLICAAYNALSQIEARS